MGEVMGAGRPIKRHGIQACDACGRDFDSRLPSKWICPRCGYDNAAAMRERERLHMRAATRAAAAAREAARRERENG